MTDSSDTWQTRLRVEVPVVEPTPELVAQLASLARGTSPSASTSGAAHLPQPLTQHRRGMLVVVAAAASIVLILAGAAWFAGALRIGTAPAPAERPATRTSEPPGPPGDTGRAEVDPTAPNRSPDHSSNQTPSRGDANSGGTRRTDRDNDGTERNPGSNPTESQSAPAPGSQESAQDEPTQESVQEPTQESTQESTGTADSSTEDDSGSTSGQGHGHGHQSDDGPRGSGERQPEGTQNPHTGAPTDGGRGDAGATAATPDVQG